MSSSKSDTTSIQHMTNDGDCQESHPPHLTSQQQDDTIAVSLRSSIVVSSPPTISTSDQTRQGSFLDDHSTRDNVDVMEDEKEKYNSCDNNAESVQTQRLLNKIDSYRASVVVGNQSISHCDESISSSTNAVAVTKQDTMENLIKSRKEKEMNKCRPSIVEPSTTDLSVGLKEEEDGDLSKKSEVHNNSPTPRMEFQSFVSAQEPRLEGNEAYPEYDTEATDKNQKSLNVQKNRPSMVTGRTIKGEEDTESHVAVGSSRSVVVAPGAVSVDGPHIYTSRSNRAYERTPSMVEHPSRSLRQEHNSLSRNFENVHDNHNVLDIGGGGTSTDTLPREGSARTATTTTISSDLAAPVGAHVVADHDNLLLVEATPLDESRLGVSGTRASNNILNHDMRDEEENNVTTKPLSKETQHGWSTKRIAIGSCLFVIVIVLVVIIPLLQRFKKTTNSSTDRGSITPDAIVNDNLIQLRATPLGCSFDDDGQPTTGIPCLNSTESLLAAATATTGNGGTTSSSFTNDFYLCPETIFTIPPSEQPIRIPSDNTTLCCVGPSSCTIRSTNAEQPIFHFVGQNAWIQRVTFLVEDERANESSSLPPVEGGGLVIVEGGGTHFIDNCVFDRGRATQVDGFQKFGGNLLVNGNTVGNAFINHTIFQNGAALRGGGGAFFERMNHLHLNECIFENNTAENGGGLGVNNVGNVTLTNNEFRNNKATSQGENAWIGRVDLLTLQGNFLSFATPEYGYVGSDQSLDDCDDGVYVSVNSTCVPFDSNPVFD